MHSGSKFAHSEGAHTMHDVLPAEIPAKAPQSPNPALS